MTLQGVMLLTVNPHGGSYTAIHSGLNADFGASTSDVPLLFHQIFSPWTTVGSMLQSDSNVHCSTFWYWNLVMDNPPLKSRSKRWLSHLNAHLYGLKTPALYSATILEGWHSVSGSSGMGTASTVCAKAFKEFSDLQRHVGNLGPPV